MDLPTDAPRSDGLAWAFAFPPDAPPALGDPRPPGGPGWDWLHYDLVHSRSRVTIEAERGFPQFARLLLIGTDETPRIVSDEHSVAGVLPSFVRSGGTDDHEIAWWRFAMLPDRLLTSRRRPAPAGAEARSALCILRLPGGDPRHVAAAAPEAAAVSGRGQSRDRR